LHVIDAHVTTHEASFYATNYRIRVLIDRFLAVLANEACGHDCNPSGKCVCGVCIPNGVEDCPWPCPRCQTFTNKVALALILSLLLALLLPFVFKQLHWYVL
jgi:hypothetical protein